MKRAQVTIFVVIGLLLVGSFGLLFFMHPGSQSSKAPEEDPQFFIDSCVQDVISESSFRIAEKGGVLSPRVIINYSFSPDIGRRPYTYLCYSPDYFYTCYTLYPLLSFTATQSLFDDTSEKIVGCFSSLNDELLSRGVDVSVTYHNHSINIIPGSIRVDLNADVLIGDAGSTQRFSSFISIGSSPLYSLIDVSQKIVASESMYCYFDYNNYMLLFPEYKIRRIDFEGSKVYHVIDRASGMTFKFAVRSCAFSLR